MGVVAGGGVGGGVRHGWLDRCRRGGRRGTAAVVIGGVVVVAVVEAVEMG